MITAMHFKRFIVFGWVLWLIGCAGWPVPQSDTADASAITITPQLRSVLAPSGVLRVGVYFGSPSSLVRDSKTGQAAGVAHDLGLELGKRLGVPVQIVEFARLQLVLDALKTGAVDFTFTNATEVRARDVSFATPIIELELGYLVPPTSKVIKIDDVSRADIRIGVSEGSSSQLALGKVFGPSKLTTASSLKVAQTMLKEGKVDVFATNKAILFELADELPGYKVLEGRWGVENLAIAIPKQREAGTAFVDRFGQDLKASGLLQNIIRRAGLRGTTQ